MSPTRERARSILERIPDQVTSKDKEGWKTCNNITQEQMEADWATGGIMTACNGFTGWYSVRLGRGGLDVTQLNAFKAAAGSAFIQSTGGVRPQYGDVFRMKIPHVGVCITPDLPGYNQNMWDVIEAGQGGPASKYDILKRRKGKPYNPADLEGWVDIEMYLDPILRSRDSIQGKLLGKWQVKIDWRVWYYTFSTNNRVTYADPKTQNTPAGAGTWSTDGTNVTIKWETGSTEVWAGLPARGKEGSGTWKDSSERPGVTTYKKQ